MTTAPAAAARTLPGPSAYLEALQDPASAFADPDLAGAAPLCTPLGLPRPFSGNFATVFRLDGDDGRRWAVRCFVRWVDDLAARYAAIGRHLERVGGTWQAPFELQEEGIRVDGEWWPILKMAWAPGQALLPWVEAHLWDGPALAYQAVRFAELVDGLRRSGVAHGDLQHGNVLVAPGGDLRLVDYDGMFVPALAGCTANDRGHRNYQHPKREAGEFGLHVDNFAAWVIYASLVALSVDPVLWGRLDGGDECLLFRAADFADPARSEALAALAASSHPVVVELGRLLRSFLELDFAAVPPLAPDRAPVPDLSAPAVAPVDLARQQRLLAALRSAEPAAPPSAAVEEVRPRPHAPVPAVTFTHLPAPRRAAAGAGVAALATVAAVLAGAVPAALGVVALAGLAGGTYLTARRMWQHSPEVAAYQGRQAALDSARRARDDARAAVARAQEQRAALDRAEAEAATRAADAATSSGEARDAALRTIDAELHARLAELSAREQELYRAEHRELAEALRRLQREVMDADLRQRLLTAFSGLDDKVIYALALDDVRTAADFVDVAVDNEGKPSAEVAWLVRPDGRRVRASGLTVGTARKLVSWRRGLEDRLSASLPTALPDDAARAVRARFSTERASLAAAQERVRTEARARAEAAAVTPERPAPPKATPQVTAERRVSLDQDLSRARKALAEAEWALEAVEREVEAYRGLTFLAFARQVAGLR